MYADPNLNLKCRLLSVSWNTNEWFYKLCKSHNFDKTNLTVESDDMVLGRQILSMTLDYPDW